MSYIHFKSVCNQNFDKVTFDGVNLTLSQLKKLIFEKAKYNKNLNYDLEISNANNNEIIKNDNDLIQKNSYVIVRRVIKNPTGPLRSQQSKAVTTPKSAIDAAKQATVVTTNVMPTVVVDTKPVDVTSNLNKPQTKSQTMPEIKMETIKKTEIIAQPDFVQKPFESPKQPPQQMIKGQIRPLPPNYVCTYCKIPGHLKQQCPDVAAGLIPKEENRPKYPTGIPKSNMIKAAPTDPGAMLGPEGYVVHKIDHDALKEKKKDKTPFLTEEEENELKKNQQQPESKSIANIPSKLTCPFVEHGVHIIKDAVLIPCCGHFICCDECIREKISREEIVECPMKDCGHEIDSLESITSHHQMRNMVNEYLNDVKLNKFNNNKKSSKNDDVFIDLYLNDDFDTINPNSLTNENPVNDSLVVDAGIKKEDQPNDILKLNTDTLNEKEDTSNDKTEIVPAKSPLQDSNISSTIPLNGNKMNPALLPTPSSNQLIVPPVVTVPEINKLLPAATAVAPIIPAITTNSIQRIGTLSKPQTLSPQYVEGYPYVMPPTQMGNRPPMIPNKMRRLPNNISIPVHPYPMQHHPVRGPMMPYGIQPSYDGNYHQSNYYSYQTSQYTPNPSMFHQQHNIHGFNGGMPPNNYGQPFIPHNNIPSGGMQPKQLSEKEFYELKERALKRDQQHDYLHTFVNDIIDKKKRRSDSRTISRSRSRSRGRRSRSNSYSSGSNYNRRYRGGGGGDNYRRGTGSRTTTTSSNNHRISSRRSNSKTYNKRHHRSSLSRSSSRSSSSLNTKSNNQKTKIRHSSRSRSKDKKQIINNEEHHHQVIKITETETIKIKINNENLAPSSKIVNKSNKYKKSRSRSGSVTHKKTEKSRSNSKTRYNYETKEKKSSSSSNKTNRSRSRSVEKRKLTNNDQHTQDGATIKSIVKKPTDEDKKVIKSTAKLIHHDNNESVKRKSESADLGDLNSDSRKKSKKAAINENDDLISSNSKSVIKDKKDKIEDDNNAIEDENSKLEKKSKHKKAKKSKKSKHKHNRSTSRD